MSRSKPPKSATRPVPTGHTESLRAKLAERREKLGLSPDTVWERLVGELVERRADRGLDQIDVARALREEAEGPGADQPRKGTRISNWESMTREPRIDEFAAWARALGMRLEVELEPVDSPRKAVMIHPDRTELAKLVDLLEPAKVADATRIIEHLHNLTRGEVRRLADVLTLNADD